MQNITLTNEEAKRIVGATVYNANGKRLGEVTNISLSKAKKLTAIACSDGTNYTRGQLMGVDEIVIVKLPKPATDKAKPDVKRPKQNVKPSVPPKPTVRPEVDALPEPNAAAEKTYPVRRRYGDFSFLLGKIVDKDITNFYDEIMLRKGATVTHDVLRQAKISGKLIELCLHAE